MSRRRGDADAKTTGLSGRLQAVMNSVPLLQSALLANGADQHLIYEKELGCEKWRVNFGASIRPENRATRPPVDEEASQRGAKSPVVEQRSVSKPRRSPCITGAAAAKRFRIFLFMSCVVASFRGCLAATALLLSGVVATQAGTPCSFTLARLKYGGGGDWYANPSSLPNLMSAVRTRTSIPACDTIAVVEIGDERLFEYPMLYVTGHGNIRFTLKERLRLREYLIGGGFLWADDNYGMDKSFRRELQALFPENAMTELPRSHPVYKSKYALAGLPKIHEHDGEPAQGMGLFFNGRLVVYYSYSSDIGDGMEDVSVHNDGEELHELALRMGVNIVAWFFSP